MSTPHYDIYFRGECLEGFDAEHVKRQLALLFKASPEKMQLLFSGKVVALRKGLDKAGAIKFKQILEKAGAKIYIKAMNADSAASAGEEKPKPAQSPNVAKADASAKLDVLPVGSDVLSEAERTAFIEAYIDISHINLTSTFDAIESQEKPQPPAPDVSHLSAADVGADILEGFRGEAIPLPETDISHITLAEAGADLLLAAEELDASVEPRTEHLSLAEVGADIDPNPKAEPPPAPDVSHIKLDD